MSGKAGGLGRRTARGFGAERRLIAALPVLTFYKAAPEEEMPSIVDTNEGVLMANAPLISNRSLIDPDTPRSAFTKEDYMGNEMKLVFSDEFNVDGRYFYPGELIVHSAHTPPSSQPRSAHSTSSSADTPSSQARIHSGPLSTSTTGEPT